MSMTLCSLHCDAIYSSSGPFSFLMFALSQHNVASQLNGVHFQFNEDSLITSSLHNTESVFHFSEPSGNCNCSIECCTRFILYQTGSTGPYTELVHHYTGLEGHDNVALCTISLQLLSWSKEPMRWLLQP